MSRFKILTGIGIFVCWAWLVHCGLVAAQAVERQSADSFQPNLGSWEQRVLKANTGRLASYQALEPGDISAPVAAEGVAYEDGAYAPAVPGGYLEEAPAYGGGCGAACGGGYGACGNWCAQVPCCWYQGLSVFAGMQGFKNALDQGRNGNFGFHEGVNFGMPLGYSPISFQVGFQALQSDFLGEQTHLVNNRPRYEIDRHDQIFFTTGFFHRTSRNCGWQGGIVFDHLHDNYYVTSTLQQLRAELSFRCNWQQEFGYWGAYGLDSDRFSNTLEVTSKDLHTFFYRHHFSGGALARAWTGFSGDGEWLFGGEAAVPLGSSWALENSFAYVLPKDKGRAGQEDETWSIMMRLVWYPGRCSREAINVPYQPLMGVADNTVFMLDRK
jgi:hypothetical protein